MASKKKVEPPPPQRTRIPVYLLPEELELLSDLCAHYTAVLRVEIKMGPAIKLSMRDAAKMHGLRPRKPGGGA